MYIGSDLVLKLCFRLFYGIFEIYGLAKLRILRAAEIMKELRAAGLSRLPERTVKISVVRMGGHDFGDKDAVQSVSDGIEVAYLAFDIRDTFLYHGSLEDMGRLSCQPRLFELVDVAARHISAIVKLPQKFLIRDIDHVLTRVLYHVIREPLGRHADSDDRRRWAETALPGNCDDIIPVSILTRYEGRGSGVHH